MFVLLFYFVWSVSSELDDDCDDALNMYIYSYINSTLSLAAHL